MYWYLQEPTILRLFITLPFYLLTMSCKFIQLMHNFLSTGLKSFVFILFVGQVKNVRLFTLDKLDLTLQIQK